MNDICIPGDKSMSHRAVILASIADRVSTISNLLLSEDIFATIHSMRLLGVDIQVGNSKTVVHGVGLHGLKKPKQALDCGNSGTTMRLLTGLLSAQKFESVLIGDDSLMKRPMARVAKPLQLMGARIQLSPENTAPIQITGNPALTSICYESPIASAQVKSAILLAGLYAKGNTTVIEKTPTRDHTEKMLAFMGFGHESKHDSLTLQIPGDISSACLFYRVSCNHTGFKFAFKKHWH